MGQCFILRLQFGRCRDLVRHRLTVQGNGTTTDVAFGGENEKAVGNLRLRADENLLNSADSFHAAVIGAIGTHNHILKCPDSTEVYISSQGPPPHTVSVIGLRPMKDDSTETADADVKRCYPWANDEKTLPGPFDAPEIDELTGDQICCRSSLLLTTCCLNIDDDSILDEAKIKQATHCIATGGQGAG